jgi:hypothetical protein
VIDPMNAASNNDALRGTARDAVLRAMIARLPFAYDDMIAVTPCEHTEKRPRSTNRSTQLFVINP